MENQTNIKCPFCKSELEHDALVCHKCNAERGVGYSLLTKRLISKSKAKNSLLIYGLIYVFAFFYAYTKIDGGYKQDEMIMIFVCMVYVVVMTIPISRFLGLSFRGERWFR